MLKPPVRMVSTSLGPAAQVPVQYFLDQVLPPLHPDINVEQVVAKLKRSGKRSHRPITKAGRWWGFAKNPATVKRREACFINFPRMVNAIARCGAPKGVVPLLEIALNPQPTYEREENSLPDAYMILRGMDRRNVAWTSVGVIGEYEKNPEFDEDNVDKISWSLSRAFDDPRRRFVYGYTVEDTNMRLWFCDKTQILVSEKFNFITNHRTVSHVFLSFIYAEPHHLGWDTSMNATDDGTQYDFTVEDTDGTISIFRSLALVFEGPEIITGKGTKIWKAIQVIDGVPRGEPVVLKDSWVNEEMTREGTTLHDIQHSNHSDEFHEAFASKFLTVICHGDVIIHSQRGPPHVDRTRLHVENSRAYRSGQPLTDDRHLPPGERVVYPKRGLFSEYLQTNRQVHYRIVYKEFCRPLTLSMPLSVVFPALSEACQALKLLHEAGWVHRDISMGNIMLDASDHARLADLEYAKRMGDETIPEIRIGTAPFVSAEVMAQTYWFTDQLIPLGESEISWKKMSPRSRMRRLGHEELYQRLPNESTIDEAMRLARYAQEQMLKSRLGRCSPDTDSPSPTPPSSSSDGPPGKIFRYNPLHDLESVFWIVVLHLFNTFPENMDEKRIKKQREVAARLLYEQNRHCDAIRLHNTLHEDMSHLHRSLRRPTIILGVWRSQLSRAFYAAERDCTSITCSIAAGLHDSFVEAMRRMTDMAKEIEEGVATQQRSSLAQGSRKRTIDDLGGEGARESSPSATVRLKKKTKIHHSEDVNPVASE